MRNRSPDSQTSFILRMATDTSNTNSKGWKLIYNGGGGVLVSHMKIFISWQLFEVWMIICIHKQENIVKLVLGHVISSWWQQ